MKFINYPFSLILITMLNIKSFSNTKYIVSDSIKDKQKMGFGICGGWGATYGLGTQISYLIIDNIDINAGFGFSFNGFKVGVGGRLYILKEKDLSPYLGLNFVHSTGLSRLTVTINNDQGMFSILSDQTINMKVGIRYKERYLKFNKIILVTLGYGYPLNGYDAKYLSGSKSVQNFANLFTVGGIEISATVIFYFKK